jgi:hypothetical protein
MPTADLNDAKLISEEISIIKDKLNKLQNKKEIKHEEISDSEYEYKTDNGTDDETEEKTKNEIIEPVEKENEKENNKDEVEVEDEDEDEDENEDENEEEYLNEIKELIEDEKNKKSLEMNIKKNKSIDLTKYVKKEVKQYLNAFDVNITRLIKKYKHVDDITENELLKIQSKYNIENKYFNKKSKKLLNKLKQYDDLTDEDYEKMNKKIKQIRKRFTNFIEEFIDIDGNETHSEED